MCFVCFWLQLGLFVATIGEEMASILSGDEVKVALRDGITNEIIKQFISYEPEELAPPNDEL